MTKPKGLERLATVALAGLALTCVAGRARAAHDPFEPKSIRWEEDYAWLKAPETPPEGLDRLKFIPLSEDRDAWLSLGGEVRQRVDMIKGAGFGLGAAQAYDTAQTRIYVHADAHLGSSLRVFGQLSYADEGGRRPHERAFDESAPDIQQLFVDLTPVGGARLRLGRQELPLGDQRLSEARETYNLRRSFDAARLDLTVQGATLTAFSGVLMVNRPGAFDDEHQPGERFQGLYLALPEPSVGGGLDLFWLERRRARSVYSEGAAKERRETFGARLHGARDGFDYNIYAVGQTGRFGAAGIAAWAASADIGWTADQWAWRPRLGLRADIASGDDRAGDGELNSFDAPYPNTSYLSTSSAYWPGNAWSVFPLITLHPGEAVGLYLGGQTMTRMSDADGFYYSAQNPIALSSDEGGAMMRQVYCRVRWQPARRVVFSGTVIRQLAGSGVRALGGRDSDIVSLSGSWKF